MLSSIFKILERLMEKSETRKSKSILSKLKGQIFTVEEMFPTFEDLLFCLKKKKAPANHSLFNQETVTQRSFSEMEFLALKGYTIQFDHLKDY